MRLFRLMIYVENKENLTYIVSTTTTTTKTGMPAQPALLFHGATNSSQTQKKAQLKVSFNLPTLTIPSAPATRARSSGLFPQAALETDGRR